MREFIDMSFVDEKKIEKKKLKRESINSTIHMRATEVHVEIRWDDAVVGNEYHREQTKDYMKMVSHKSIRLFFPQICLSD